MDTLLRELGVTTLIFTGCTTSVCVASTLRDAFFRDYTCLLLADCTAEAIGGEFSRSSHAATLLLIELLFGSVANSDALVKSLSEQLVAEAV